jgi:hypothetical protein
MHHRFSRNLFFRINGLNLNTNKSRPDRQKNGLFFSGVLRSLAGLWKVVL